jgi:phage protein D
LVLGNCDRQEFDPWENVIELSGRDLTSEMIDAKAGEIFLNQKASAIAQTIAGRHGWTADVDDTSALDGTYFEIDHARLRHAATEWDLLCELADDYGYNVWMTGKTLHFKVQDSANSGVYMIRWVPRGAQSGAPQANAERLKFSRNLMLGKSNVTAQVNSWNLKNKKKFTGKSTAAKTGAGASGTLTYTYNQPGLTQDQVKKVAKAKLKGIIRNEMTLHASLPADNVLTTRALIQVAGTGTAYDQTYWPVNVSRRMSLDGGYTMDVEAKNHAPGTETDS